MKKSDLEIIRPIVKKYHDSFSKKTYNDENNEHDFLMDLFNISPELKRQNRQYWGRELGMCWQLIVTEIARANCGSDFHPALRFDLDEPCDLIIGSDAIDTKYRIGSGDSGTLKKFKQYGKLLKEKGYKPILLIVRDDNLPAAITACRNGGWEIYTKKQSLDYIKKKIGVDLDELLSNFETNYYI